jgi:hypothetical protein
MTGCRGAPTARTCTNTNVDLGALGIAGTTLILNEQAITGDGINMSSLRRMLCI